MTVLVTWTCAVQRQRCHAIAAAPSIVFLVLALGPVKLPVLHRVYIILCVGVCLYVCVCVCATIEEVDATPNFFKQCVFVLMCVRCVHCAISVVLCNGPQICYTEGLDQGHRLRYRFFSLPLVLPSILQVYSNRLTTCIHRTVKKTTQYTRISNYRIHST